MHMITCVTAQTDTNKIDSLSPVFGITLQVHNLLGLEMSIQVWMNRIGFIPWKHHFSVFQKDQNNRIYPAN